MSFGSFLKHVGGYIPGVSNVEGIAQGDLGKALAGPVYQGAEDLGIAPSSDWSTWGNLASDIGHGIGHAINKPYDEKRKGYDAVMGMVDADKAERYGQKQKSYDLQMQAYDPTRKAIAALYGDPANWKL